MMLCVSSTVEAKPQVAVPLETVWLPLTQVMLPPVVLSWNVTVPPLTVLVLETVAVRVLTLVGDAVKMVLGFGALSEVVVFAPRPVDVRGRAHEPIEPAAPN